MNAKTIFPRITTLLVLIGLVLSQLATLSPVQAAVADINLNLSGTSFSALPNEGMTVTVTETFGNFSTVKNNVFTDILFTLNPPSGVSLGVLSITALNTGITPNPTITLAAGQTKFWASSFGGSFARKSLKKASGKQYSYTLVFTGGSALKGVTIPMTVMVVADKNNLLKLTSASFAYQSVEKSAQLKVFNTPVLTSGNIAGPYITGKPKTFRIIIQNPIDGADYTSNKLHVNYQLGNDGSTVPSLEYMDYQSSTNQGSTWTALAHIPTPSVNGEFETAGYSLPAGQELWIDVTFKFTNASRYHFPFALNLTDSLGKPLDSLSSVAVVNPEAAELSSSDLYANYNAGVTREFHVTAINPSGTGGTYPTAYLSFVFSSGLTSADIPVFQYYDAGWKNVTWDASGTIATTETFMLNNSDLTAKTIKFQINITRPGTYTVNTSMKQDSGQIAAIPLPNNITVTATVPSLDLTDVINNAPFDTNLDQSFNVMVNNPATGGNYSNLHLQVVFSNVAPANINRFNYVMGGGNPVPIVMNSDGSGGSVGSVTPTSWSLVPSGSSTLTFTINVSVPTANTVMTFTLYDGSTLLTSQPVYFDMLIPVTGDLPIYLPLVTR